jgi:hypothetical protein
MDRSTMMKMCFPSRAQTYSKLPTFDDYSEQFSDEAPLNCYDSLESPTSSRRSSLTSSGTSNAYDPEPALSKKEAADKIELGFTRFSHDKDLAKEEDEEGVEKGSEAVRDVGACEEEDKSQDTSDKGAPTPSPPPRSRVVRFLQDAMTQKPLPPVPSL